MHDQLDPFTDRSQRPLLTLENSALLMSPANLPPMPTQRDIDPRRAQRHRAAQVSVPTLSIPADTVEGNQQCSRAVRHARHVPPVSSGDRTESVTDEAPPAVPHPTLTFSTTLSPQPPFACVPNDRRWRRRASRRGRSRSTSPGHLITSHGRAGGAMPARSMPRLALRRNLDYRKASGGLLTERFAGSRRERTQPVLSHSCADRRAHILSIS